MAMQYEKDLDTSLAERDLVALFPPVGGGWHLAGRDGDDNSGKP